MDDPRLHWAQTELGASLPVTDSRYRWGGVAWVLTLQFFVVEAIAAARYGGYSYSQDVISDLGAGDSPARLLMNGSFVAQGVLITAGALLLGPGLAGLGGRLARVLLTVAGLGVLVVGLFPSDSVTSVHEIAAAAHFLGGAIGLIALAYGVRPRSEALGTTLAVLGLIGLIATIFFGAAVFLFLGEGGMERVAGYVIPVGLAVTGVALWRQKDSWWQLTNADGSPSRRQLREDARLARARKAAERDAALEAAAQRGPQSPAPTTGATAAGAPGDDDPDDFDPDDPWAPRR
ncbi:putative membrane protein [Modestobacter roseus]|uniref:Putative membrane protein n=1 Tax=Modestobacter roseus TaxID=1181884 RepID=A0A562INF7_9ACTN|nr:putative membrane protein [Modestobacter roseus]